MEDVYKHIPQEMLPREYLPDDYEGPCAGTLQELLGTIQAFNSCPKCVCNTGIINTAHLIVTQYPGHDFMDDFTT